MEVKLVIRECHHCGREDTVEYCFDITDNVNPIVERCFQLARLPSTETSWKRLDGYRAQDSTALINAASQFANLSNFEQELRKLEPKNKYGTLESVRKAFDGLIEACKKYPLSFIVVQ